MSSTPTNVDPQSFREIEVPGRLFIVEGIDGSGKSTQLDLLHKWLVSRGYLTVFTEWNSSPPVPMTCDLTRPDQISRPPGTTRHTRRVGYLARHRPPYPALLPRVQGLLLARAPASPTGL